jgi:hypothetical protein
MARTASNLLGNGENVKKQVEERQKTETSQTTKLRTRYDGRVRFQARSNIVVSDLNLQGTRPR